MLETPHLSLAWSWQLQQSSTILYHCNGCQKKQAKPGWINGSYEPRSTNTMASRNIICGTFGVYYTQSASMLHKFSIWPPIVSSSKINWLVPNLTFSSNLIIPSQCVHKINGHGDGKTSRGGTLDLAVDAAPERWRPTLGPMDSYVHRK